MLLKHRTEENAAWSTLWPGLWRVTLVGVVLLALGVCGVALYQLRVHGSIPAMARAYERQARLEREQFGGETQALPVFQTHARGEQPDMVHKHHSHGVK
ncbi:MAG: hypothetical protein IPG93_22860 [Burkholderiales bacterium]|nr:hypothetical protein [Burkholderiales bacterium]